MYEITFRFSGINDHTWNIMRRYNVHAERVNGVYVDRSEIDGDIVDIMIYADLYLEQITDKLFPYGITANYRLRKL